MAMVKSKVKFIFLVGDRDIYLTGQRRSSLFEKARIDQQRASNLQADG